jgi:3-oxoacyl-[acyl-carrier protein] reductase
VSLGDGVHVVVGGASGIGLATAERLAGSGTPLLLADLDAERLTAAADRLGADSLTVDVCRPDSVRALGERLAGLTVKGLVNTAGVVELGTIADVDEGRWQRVIDVNLSGTYRCCRALVPLLAASGGGAIVNLASVSGRTRSIYSSPGYVASKAGVIGLTMVLAAQEAGRGVRVNCVAPGIVDTPMLSAYSDEQRGRMRDAVPLGRFASAGEVAASIVYLLSEDASYVTGQTLNVNGGQFMQ